MKIIRTNGKNPLAQAFSGPPSVEEEIEFRKRTVVEELLQFMKRHGINRTELRLIKLSRHFSRHNGERGDSSAWVQGYPAVFPEKMAGSTSRYIHTRDMIRKCVAAGLPEPEFSLTDSFVTTIRKPVSAGRPPVTDPVTDPVDRVVLTLASGEMAPSALWERLGLKHRPTFRENYLHPALERGLVEPTIPQKPTSPLQKYRLTEKGREHLNSLNKKGGK